MTRLSELVSQHLPAGTDHRTLAAAIRAQGKESVSDSWVYHVINGSHPQKIQERKLRAFADYLGIPMEDARAAAGVPVGETEPFKLPAEADRLDSEQREVIRHMIRVLLRDDIERQSNEHTESEATVTDISPKVDERPRAVADQKKAAKKAPPNIAPDELGHST